MCRHAGCNTKLSMYNNGKYCFQHEPMAVPADSRQEDRLARLSGSAALLPLDVAGCHRGAGECRECLPYEQDSGRADLLGAGRACRHPHSRASAVFAGGPVTVLEEEFAELTAEAEGLVEDETGLRSLVGPARPELRTGPGGSPRTLLRSSDCSGR